MGNENIINRLCGCKDNNEEEDASKKDKVIKIILLNIFQEKKNEMIINSVLSSTKDNSIQNNKKKNLFSNSKPLNQNNNTANINTNININNTNINSINNNNINNENSLKQTPKKKKIILSNNTIYEGYLLNNEFDGYGELRSPNYNYFGNFSRGKKNGKGKLEDFVNKIEYTGDFKDNIKEGFGEEKYQDGSVYKGEFRQNMKNGKGNLLIGGGKNYMYWGTFKNDKICGKGKLKMSEEKIYLGNWENDEISGYGFFKEENLRHVGYFKHNIKEGFGATFYNEGNFAILGKWVNDLIEGFAMIINLPDNNSKKKENGNKEKKRDIVVEMNKGQIIKMSLDDNEYNKFKESEDYKEMIKLYQEKFYVDFIKYSNEDIENEDEENLMLI